MGIWDYNNAQGINSYTELQVICICFNLALIARYLLPQTLSMKYRIFWGRYLNGRAPYVSWIIPTDLFVWMSTIYLLQGHFHLCYRGGQEDQLDLHSHFCHLFQAARLVLGDPKTMLNTDNMVKIVYQIISNPEILCEIFQTFLYNLSGVFSFFSRCLLRWPFYFLIFFVKQSESSFQLCSVRSFSYPCTWSSWTSNCTLWTQGTLWRKVK